MKLSRRGLLLVLSGVTCFLAIALLPDWARIYWRHYVPRWIERGAIDLFLQATRALYLLALTTAPLAAIVSAVRLGRARRRSHSATWSARVLVLSITVLGLLMVCEIGAGRMPFGSPALPKPSDFTDDPDSAIDLVVIGESTAAGWPYQPKFSAAQFVAWQLEQALADRQVRIDTQAVEPGSCLEQMIPRLKRLRYRPELVLVCAGHNEFQTRYGWPRQSWYYTDSRSAAVGALEWFSGLSNVVGLLNRAIDRNQIDALPADLYRRQLIDCPSCTPAERAVVLENYRGSLEALAAWCETLKATLIVVAPPSNLGSFPPNRSYLCAETPAAEREAFAQAFMKTIGRESDAPADAEAELQRLLATQPTFAEAHFHLARLLQRRGQVEQAETHYRQARDFDGMPLRCPSDFADAAREICSRHPSAVFVDGPEILRQLSPHGIVDDHLMHDAQHPTLRGHLALGEAAAEELAARQVFGWPKDVKPRELNLADCIEEFRIDRASWETACIDSALFYEAVAGLRHDPDVLLKRSTQYREAARRIAAGESADSLGITGLGVVGEPDQNK